MNVSAGENSTDQYHSQFLLPLVMSLENCGCLPKRRTHGCWNKLPEISRSDNSTSRKLYKAQLSSPIKDQETACFQYGMRAPEIITYAWWTNVEVPAQLMVDYHPFHGWECFAFTADILSRCRFCTHSLNLLVRIFWHASYHWALALIASKYSSNSCSLASIVRAMQGNLEIFDKLLW